MKSKKAHVPSMNDAAVKAKTGKDWAGWFGVLDKAAAAKLNHREIVAILSDQYGVPTWWRQMVAVEYERAKGIRVPHQTSGGFSIAVSKTMAASLSALYLGTADAATRKKWFPKGRFTLSTTTKDKYFRGSWNDTARLETGFYAKGPNRAQIAVQISKLESEAQVAAERSAWKVALAKLQTIVEGA